jgi:hypothetical protein
LSTPGVIAGLHALVELDLLAAVEHDLLVARPAGVGLTANAVLVSGAISVLGQPLGIGQGDNPSCQAARCISLWAAHAPGHLLTTLADAARDGAVSAVFEGVTVRSNEVCESLLGAADPKLDPVQTVLVPHLNRIYDWMIARTGLRAVDSHKWINPAMYGRFVPAGFAACVDPRTQVVSRYEDFLRMFFATHHPDFNGCAELRYPNPVGLLVTDARGRYLGPHAVAIERVARDPLGEVRVYFFNPNTEGRQRWAPAIAPTVRGFGELPGESSLPFVQFASRIYAFHFDAYQQGDAYAISRELLDAVSQLARESWAPAFHWSEAPL